MAIDAQSIASIGQNAPDIAGSTMKAYTLADAIDRRQLNQMTLQSTREEQADLSKIKTLSQQYDISNPEQRHELASRVQKEVGGKYAMDFMRMADEQDRRSAELSAAQMQNYQAKHEVMTNAILPMFQQIQASTQQGMPPGQIEAQLLPAFKQTLDTLMKQTLPNGEKVLNQQDIQQISTMLSGQPGALLSGINSAMASSRTAQEFFAKQAKDRRDEANVQSEIEHRRTLEKQGQTRLDIEAGRLKVDRDKEAREQKKAEENKGFGGRSAVVRERVMSSANLAAQAIENISKLPVGAGTGWLGIGNKQGHSILDAVGSNLKRELSSQETRTMGTLMSGLERNLATIESQGLAPPGTFTDSMKNLEIKQGDSPLDAIIKLAEMRQIVEVGLQTTLQDPIVPKELKDGMQAAIAKVQKAVPFTQEEALALTNNPNKSIHQMMEDKKKAASDTSKGAITKTWVRGPDGKLTLSAQ